MSNGPKRRLKAVPITADSDHSIKRLAGWSIHEDGGLGSIIVKVRHADGAGGATGTLVGVVETGADSSLTETFGKDNYVPADHPDGFHVEVETGNIEGVLYEAL